MSPSLLDRVLGFLRWIQGWALYALLNVYAVIALGVGVFFLVGVDQSREIFANLLDTDAQLHLWLYVAGLVFWAASIWYSMRLLSSTRFPAASPRRWSETIRAETPRLSGFAALVCGALASGLFLESQATLRVLLVLATGAPALTWAVMTLGDYAFKSRLKPASCYPIAVPLVCLACALVVGWGSDLVSLKLRLPDEYAEWQLAVSVVVWLASTWAKDPQVQATLRLASLAAWAAVWLFLGPTRASFVPLVVLVAASAGLWWTSRRRDLHRLSHSHAGKTEDPGPLRLAVLVMTMAILGLLIFGFSNYAIAWGNALGTFAIAFLAFSLWCFFGTVIWVYWPKRYGLASFAIVPVVWALAGPSADHSMRNTTFGADKRPAVRAHLAEWRKGLPRREEFEKSRHPLPKDYKSPVFVVAASGGGLRAAYWTAAVLAAMDDATCGQFGRHVYAYSGVSGGSLGIAAYLAQRRVWEAGKTLQERCANGRVPEITAFLNQDFLAPVAGTALFAEGFQRFTFVKYLQNERGNVLADSWSKAWDDAYPRTPNVFREPFVQALGAPAVFLNATGVASGRRVIASNVAAAIPGADDFFAPHQGVALKTQGLSVSEAVLNSARFTYVSPAGTVEGCFPTKGEAGRDCAGGKVGVWDRVVDGGYFENSGLATLSDVLRVVRRKEKKQDPSPLPNPVFFIIITNSAGAERACLGGKPYDLVRNSLPADEKKDEDDPDADEAASLHDTEVTSLAGLTAPIDALLSVREARAGLEVRRVAAMRKCSHILDWSLFPEMNVPQKETPRAKGAARRQKGDEAEELQQQPALGWFLSHRSTAWMKSRAYFYARELPFQLAACYDSRKPSRGLIGGPEVEPYRCPGDARSR